MKPFRRNLLSLALAAALCAQGALAATPLNADVAVDPLLRRAFVTNSEEGTLSMVNLDHMTALGAVAAGPRPRRVLADSANSRLYVLNVRDRGMLTVLDAQSGSTIAQAALGDTPSDIAADFPRGVLYVSNRDSNTVAVFDIVANGVVATIGVGNAPDGLGIDAPRGNLYVTNVADGTVSVIDVATHAVVRTIGVGRSPGRPAVDARGRRVLVNNSADRTISVIDVDSGAVVATLATGAGSTNGTLSAELRKYYLPNAGDGTLTAVDLDTLAVDTIDVGRSPQRAWVDASSGIVYVTDDDAESVTAVSAAAQKVAFRVPTKGRATRVAPVPALEAVVLLSEDADEGPTLTVAFERSLAPDTAIAGEYYHAGFDHYFHTAGAVEKRLIDDGVYGEAWRRTDEFFRVWTMPGPDRVAVCRFYSAGNVPKTSHVYTPYTKECMKLKAGNTWSFESIAYFVGLPDGDGHCAAGTEPLFRLYNDGQGGAPNHRFTASARLRDAMHDQGWVIEGSGAEGVFACTPPLRAAPLDANESGMDDGESGDATIGAPPPLRFPIPLRPVPLLARIAPEPPASHMPALPPPRGRPK